MADLRLGLSVAAALVVMSGAALAQQAPAGPAAPTDQTITLPTVEIVAVTPLLGSGVNPNKVPAQTQVLNAQDISRNGYPQALQTLNQQVPGVNARNSKSCPARSPHVAWRN